METYDPARDPVELASEQHRLTLLPSPASTLDALASDISRARERVWIEAFVVRDDGLGRRLASWLSGARARDVDTRLMFDPLGSRTTRRAIFERCQQAGTEVRAYRPWDLPWRGSARWPRDHARIFCVDEVAYVGGVAFGDEWLPADQGGKGWHDVCCRIEGPGAAALAEIFELRWHSATTRDHPRNVIRRDWPELTLVADAPADREGIYAMYRERVQRARSRIWIENGYFFPPRRILSDLTKAADRGVDVQVIVPAGSDVPTLASAARGEFARWTRAGIKVFEYLPTMCHAKFALIDDDWATVGSFNLNPTSLISTNECNVFVFDRAFVGAAADLFQADRALCRSVTLERLRARPLAMRMKSVALRAGMRSLEALAWLIVGAMRRVARGEHVLTQAASRARGRAAPGA